MSDSASPPFNYGGDETDPEVVGPRPKRIRHKPMSAAQQKAALSSLRAKLAEPAPKPPAISDTASKAQAPVSADVKQKNPELDAETTSPDEAAQSDDDAAKSGDEHNAPAQTPTNTPNKTKKKDKRGLHVIDTMITPEVRAILDAAKRLHAFKDLNDVVAGAKDRLQKSGEVKAVEDLEGMEKAWAESNRRYYVEMAKFLHQYGVAPMGSLL